MTAFTARTSTHMGVDRILSSVTVTALYNNLIAAFEGDATAVAVGLQLAFAAIKSNALASQANVEAEQSGVLVQPNFIRYHPGVAKAWVKADFAGNITTSYNVSGITDGGTGIVSVSWGNDFSTGNYVALGTAYSDTTTPIVVTRNVASGVSSADANFRSFESTTGPLQDATNWSIAALGDQ